MRRQRAFMIGGLLATLVGGVAIGLWLTDDDPVRTEPVTGTSAAPGGLDCDGGLIVEETKDFDVDDSDTAGAGPSTPAAALAEQLPGTLPEADVDAFEQVGSDTGEVEFAAHEDGRKVASVVVERVGERWVASRFLGCARWVEDQGGLSE